jgi:hypothetical protein
LTVTLAIALTVALAVALAVALCIGGGCEDPKRERQHDRRRRQGQCNSRQIR